MEDDDCLGELNMNGFYEKRCVVSVITCTLT